VKAFFLLALLATAARVFAAPEPIALWPQNAPGEKAELPPEADLTKSTDGPVAGKPLIRLGNVSHPTITIFPPPREKDTGAAVLVCPGGGYNILAWDLEGTEVCEWLNSIGVTGVLLKYRVPKRDGLEKHGPALQDAQRAMGIVRQRAGELGVDRARIGVLGFSAGGHLAAALCSASEARTYSKTDAADELSCRPGFAVLVYPAYLTLKDDDDKVAPELRVTAHTPPTFLVQTQDDSVRVESSVVS
jgi:acetyl esterase/lipase